MKEESCGNGGVVESVEIQRQDFPSSPHSLEISQNRRDSHIPTALRQSLKINAPLGFDQRIEPSIDLLSDALHTVLSSNCRSPSGRGRTSRGSPRRLYRREVYPCPSEPIEILNSIV
jgi:hypothetical protein